MCESAWTDGKEVDIDSRKEEQHTGSEVHVSDSVRAGTQWPWDHQDQQTWKQNEAQDIILLQRQRRAIQAGKHVAWYVCVRARRLYALPCSLATLSSPPPSACVLLHRISLCMHIVLHCSRCIATCLLSLGLFLSFSLSASLSLSLSPLHRTPLCVTLHALARCALNIYTSTLERRHQECIYVLLHRCQGRW